MSDDGLQTARAIARIMDDAVRIPGTNIRVGLDAVLGLLPGLGDVSGTVFGGYLVLLAARSGAGGPVIGRMLLNLGVDTALGAVPLLGDIVDIGWKANRRNLALLERAMTQPEAARRSSVAVLAGAVAGIAALAFAGVALTVWAIAALVRSIG